MTTTTGERLLADYLARLDAAALRLPPDRQTELVEGIAEHVAAAREAGELHDEAAVRTLLDRLGEPEEIVAAAGDDLPASWGPSEHGATSALAPRSPGTGLETAAVLMLTVGSLLPVGGWLVGVVLLWTSRRWRTREKLLGTLVVPGGPGILLLLSVFPVRSTLCTTEVQVPVPVPGTGAPDAGFSPPGPVVESGSCESAALLPSWLLIPLLALVLVAPFVVAVVLLRRARARAAAEPPALGPVGNSSWGGLEIAAVVLIGVGTFVVPGVGPLVGLVLAWSSNRWSTAQKGVATTLVAIPVALFVLVLVLAQLGLSVGLGPFSGGLVLLVLLGAAGPLLAAGYLALALGRR